MRQMRWRAKRRAAADRCFQSSIPSDGRCPARRWRDGPARSATGARRRLSPFRTSARTICPWRSRGRRRCFGRSHRQWPRSLAYQIAQVYAVRGEKDKASSGYKSPLIITTPACSSLLVDPLLRGLRDDPRYKNLVVKVGLPATS